MSKRAAEMISNIRAGGMAAVLVITMLMSQEVYAKTYTAGTLEQYKQFLAQGIASYEDVIKINYTGSEIFSKTNPMPEIRALYSEIQTGLNPFDGQNVITINESLQMKVASYSDERYLKNGQYTIGYKNSAAEIQEIDTIIDENLNQITAKCKNDYEIVRAVYEYVLNKFYYQKLASNDDDLDNLMAERNLLKGIKGTNGVVCDAYAMLFSRILTKLGYENVIVSGTVFENELHVWNKVKLGDNWYNVDPTWGDSAKPGNKEKYFLSSDAVFSDSGHVWDISKYPYSPKGYVLPKR